MLQLRGRRLKGERQRRPAWLRSVPTLNVLRVKRQRLNEWQVCN
jgi:hypothetical protein